MPSPPFLFLIASVLLFLCLISNSNSYADSNDNSADTINVTFDSYPRISPIVIDGLIYLPSQQPVTLSWINDSSVHTFSIPEISVYESSGKRYAFETWNDLDKNIVRTIKAKEIKNNQFIALFKTQYLLTIISDYSNPKGGGWYVLGEIPEFTVEDPAIYLSEDNRVVFGGWSAGYLPESIKNHIEIKAPTVVVASWKEQYRVNVISDIGHAGGSGWYDKGSSANIMIDDIEVEAEEKKLKFVFKQWEAVDGLSIIRTDKSAPAVTIKVDRPHTIEAQWYKMYFVTLDSNYGNPSGQGYYNENELAKLSIETVHEVEPGKTRLAFAGWQEIKDDEGQGRQEHDLGGADSKHVLNVVVNEPGMFKALWIEQHFVNVKSEYGRTSGSGWYNAGSTAKIFVIEPSATVNLGFGKNAVFRGWILEPLLVSSSDSQPYTGFSSSKSGTIAPYVIENIDQPYELQAVWFVDETWRYVTIFLSLTTSSIILWFFARLRKKRASKNMARIRKMDRRHDLIATDNNDIGNGESKHHQSLEPRSA